MRKNGFLCLVIVLIGLFSFNMEVKAAAKELTCVYGSIFKEQSVALVQSEGKLTIYKNDIFVDVTENGWNNVDGWHKTNFDPYWSNGNEISIDSLNSCPKSVGEFVGIYLFKDDNEDGSMNLLKEFEDVFSFLNATESIVSTINDVAFKTVDLESKSSKSCDEIDNFWLNEYDNSKTTLSCLYIKDLSDAALKKLGDGCHIIQMDVVNDMSMFFYQNQPFSSVTNKKFSDTGLTLNSNTLKNEYSGGCPEEIYVSFFVFPDNTSLTQFSFLKSFFGDEASTYVRKAQIGKNLVNGEEITSEVPTIEFEKVNISSCEDLFGDSEDLIDLLYMLIKLIKIMIPMILVGLGILDFAKAVFSGAEDGMKKTLNKFIKRVIIAVAIFLIPSLLKFILGIANNIWGNIDADLCGLL